MKTRSASKKKPEIIEIYSQDQSVHEFKIDDSSCSSVSNSSSYSSRSSQSQQFLNLAPVLDSKKKIVKENLKKYLFDQHLTNLSNPQQVQIKRAPILDLLRPITQKQEATKSKQQSEEDESIEAPSPQIEQSNEELIEKISQPRKKPKLMEELQQQLHKPVEQYKLAGVKELRDQRKRQNKKRDYLIEKKFKQYRMGKKKDTVSNQVFNAIEDFFG